MISMFVLLVILMGITYASDANDTDLANPIDEDSSHPIEISSNVTDDYSASVNQDSQVKQSAMDSNAVSSTIKSKDVTKYYKSKTPYTAKFLKKNGKPLSNADVKIKVNGKVYTKKTDKNGAISHQVNLKPGKYRIQATNPATGFKLTTYFKILSTIKSKDFTKVFNDTKKLRVKFLNSYGKPLAKKKVKYKLKGKIFKAKTKRNGKITISLKKFKKGKYKITFYNNGLKKTNTIKVVKSAKTRIKSSYYAFQKSSTKVVKVRLKDEFGYRMSSGYVVKAKINGKTYKAKTNGKGVAKFKLKSLHKGIYKITYRFAGKSYYKPSKTTNKIVVISSRNPTLTVKSAKVFGYGAHNSFKVRLTAQNIPLAKKTVTFTLKGKKYVKTTDNNGIAGLPIDIPVGKNYKIKYSVGKDSLINAKYASTKITVKERIPTSVVWKSTTNFYRGYQSCMILLKDKNNAPLKGKQIELTIKYKTYKVTTNSNGYASFNVILPAGNYKVSYGFGAIGDNDYSSSKSNVKLNVTHKVSSGYGYWLKKEQFESVTMNDVSSLASQGVSDIFLNSNVVSALGKDRIESWISNVSTFGIKVHFWVQVFKNNDVWTSPIVKGKVNTKFFNQCINDIKEYSKIKGIAGIHLDYIRFPGDAYKYSGSTDAINSFIKKSTAAIRNINKELVISCALMAKTDKSGYYYGQDYSFISQYMDVVMPMVYKGNAGKLTSWITSTTRWYIGHSKGAKVWTGLQTYKSDDDITILSMNAMNKDARAAFSGGASGLILFRWGLTNYIDFNKVKS